MIKAIEFLIQMYKSPSRHLFTVQLGVAVLLAKFGIAGFAAVVIGMFLRGALGVLVDAGIYKIDLLLDAVKEGMKLKEFEKIATELYNKTMERVYSETEKQAIRKQYLEIIRKLGPVGNTPK